MEDDDIPRWVFKAKQKWELKLGHRPYDIEKKFYGKNFVYTCYFETVEQGRVCEHWTREKRYRNCMLNQLLERLGIQIIKKKVN
jgi:hypothetical protein